MQSATQVIFPDTNIFLHFKFFIEIPWEKILGAKKIVIVIPPVILSELDKHKYNHQSKQVKDRAGKVINKMAEFLESDKEIRSGVRIHFEAVEPHSEFSAFNLSRESQDDQFIASIIKYRNENPDAQISIVTNDIGLRVKAHQHKISIIKVPEEYAIASETDPTVKKLRELERQLKEYETRQPKLQLLFKNRAQRLSFRVTHFEKEKFITNQLNEIKQKYPKLKTRAEEEREKNNALERISSVAQMAELLGQNQKRIQDTDVINYNKNLEEFYSEYEEYLEEIAQIEELKNHTIAIELVVENIGNAPGEDIYVRIDFPPLLKVSDDESLFELKVEKPQAPEKPQPRLPFHYGPDIYRHSIMTMPPVINNIDRQVLDPPTRKWLGLSESSDGSFRGSFFLRKLNHGLIEECPRKIFITFNSIEEVKSFSIQYEIHAANIIKPIKGELFVINETTDNSG